MNLFSNKMQKENDKVYSLDSDLLVRSHSFPHCTLRNLVNGTSLYSIT